MKILVEKYLPESVGTLGHDVASGHLKKAKATINDALFKIENQVKLLKGGRGRFKDPDMDKTIKKLDDWVKTLKSMK